jgi:NDP-sugar pyrophosphorylase family protein
MKAAIPAGGLSGLLAEEPEYNSKPMVEIGDKPILWHNADRSKGPQEMYRNGCDVGIGSGT